MANSRKQEINAKSKFCLCRHKSIRNEKKSTRLIWFGYARATWITLFALLLSRAPLKSQDADILELGLRAEHYLAAADSLEADGQSSIAVSQIVEAQKLYEQMKDWEGYAQCVLKKNVLLGVDADAERRRWLLDQAILQITEYLSPDHKLLVEALRLKGEYYIDQSELDSAQLALTEAIRIGDKTGAWGELCWALVVQAVADYYQSDFGRMEVHIDRAIFIAENKLEEPKDHLETLVQLQAILFDATGDYEKAFAASQKTLAWLQEDRPGDQIDSVGLANAYNTHGALYYERGDYDQAIHHYKIALDLHERIERDPETIIRIHNNISLSFKRKTDWEQASFHLEASRELLPLKVNGSNFEYWINTHQFRASNLVDQGKIDEAISLLNLLVPIGEKYNAMEHWLHGTMGRALLERKQPIQARHHFNISALKMQAIYGVRHPNLAKIYRLMGQAFSEQDSLHSALFYFQKALIALSPAFSDSSGFSNPPLDSVVALTELLPTLESKAEVLVRLEEPVGIAHALQTYRLAVETIDRIRENHETEEAKLLLSTHAKRIYEGSIGLLYDAYEKCPDETLWAEAFEYAEKSKSLLLLEMIRSSEARRKGVNPLYAHDTLFYDLIEKGRHIKTELLFYEQKLRAARQEKLNSEDARIKNPEAGLARLYQENLQWKKNIKANYPAYFNLQYDQQLADISTVRKNLLNEKSIFIEYFIGNSSSYLFVITQEDFKFLQIENQDELPSVIRQFEHVLRDPTALARDAQQAYMDYHQAAYRLYAVILKEAMEDVPVSMSKLVVVPDGLLNSVPFEGLIAVSEVTPTIDFGQLPYLLHDKRIHYGYSATLLLSNQRRYDEIPPNTECLALAPPYADPQTAENGNSKALKRDAGRLVDAEVEIRAIAQYFSGRYDAGPTATEAYFKQAAPTFGILHLAMHGKADFDQSKWGHLRFTDMSTDGVEDNLLHHYEITDMTLQSQLAVLSACETGVGRYEEGEGVFSLARSFMYAGVPSVVMSLWKIDDQSTGHLIPYFYRGLADRFDKNEALQKAKQDYLKEADLEFRHPYYWSGMVLLGDERPLKKKTTPYVWWLGSLALVGLILYMFLLGRRK